MPSQQKSSQQRKPKEIRKGPSDHASKHGRLLSERTAISSSIRVRSGPPPEGPRCAAWLELWAGKREGCALLIRERQGGAQKGSCAMFQASAHEPVSKRAHAVPCHVGPPHKTFTRLLSSIPPPPPQPQKREGQFRNVFITFHKLRSGDGGLLRRRQRCGPQERCRN